MKICKIKFKNIHALKGEHAIDFENGILGEAGLFVITGATGTGKSTILDIITLALYNKIPRIEKSISEKIIEEEGVILTKNAPDCYAEVEYEVKGKRYLSSWSIRRTRTGTLASRKQELTELETGTILVSSVNEVVAENERIIGLNYNQFVQSMILAQGQFSKLLLAKKDDRNALLEEITGSSIYRKIGRAVFQRFRGVEDAVKTQEIKMGETVLLTDELLKAIQDEILEKKPLFIANEVKQKELEKKKALKESILKNKHKKQLNLKEWDAFLVEKNEASSQEKQLEVHDTVVVFKDQMLQIEGADKTTSELTVAIEKGKQGVVDFEITKKELIKAAAALIGTAVTEEKLEVLLEDFRKKVVALQNVEKDILNEAKQEVVRIESKLQELKAYGIILIAGENLSGDIEQELKTIEAEITRKGIATIEAIRTKKDELSKLVLPANQLIGNRKLYDEKKKGIAELKSKIKKQFSEINDFIASQKLQKEALDVLLPIVEKAKIELEDWKQRKSLDQHRADLEPDKPCPLCGSLSHPYAQHAEDVLVSTLQDKFDELTKKSEALNKEGLLIEAKKSSAQASNAKDELDLEKREADLQIAENEIATLCSQLNWYKEDTLEKWEAEFTALQQDQTSLDKLEKYLQAKVVLTDLEKINSKYLVLKAAYLQAKETLSTVYNKKDINTDVSDLTRKFSLCLADISSLTAQLVEFTANRDKTIALKEELLAVLMPELQKREIDSLEILKSKILEEAMASQIRKKLQSIKDNEIRLQTSLKAIEETLVEEERLNDAAVTLEELNLALPKLIQMNAELQKQIWDLEQRIEIDSQNKLKQKSNQEILEALNKDLALWSKMNLLIGDAQGKKFSNFVQDLTLKQLLEYGNQRLRGFSDRYLLDVANDSDGLKVIDTYMGNTKRSVSSLSGGETFKLSLALAFGLSDLAARNVEIESLFIDEGFGSLDPESLDQAISILENMQNETNKSIGIISHVGELKDRIGSKIKLVRTGAGYSTIEIE
ncbi:AAA family ATPase [Flavobacterium muglaense]|uniref:AAA family ATPase n=1 Tax=Flavobacterium muglaense TaxID=2764716 RepID=A0A923SKU0_9FLAO|nr:AAA family ATPase [Flavobacterium muglaense]MBC5839163.1 AAA family ATPase [Flavobacterium muglaense]MBC5845623.1 AAA family ATPase [Flavobacterium muglaense]